MHKFLLKVEKTLQQEYSLEVSAVGDHSHELVEFVVRDPSTSDKWSCKIESAPDYAVTETVLLTVVENTVYVEKNALAVAALIAAF